MNDLRIAELARMAVEVDELDRDAQMPELQPELRLVLDAEQATSELRRSTRRAGLIAGVTAALAAAACIGVALTVAFVAIGPYAPSRARVAVIPPIEPEVPRVTGHVGHDHAPGVMGVGSVSAPPVPMRYASSDEQCCMVVAMVRDSGGVLRCVKWRQHEWDVQRVSSMNAADLKQAVPQPCGAPTQVVLVAMTGPTRSLPRTDEGAERLANCILAAPRSCDTDAMCFNGAAARCLPNDVSVKVETVAWNR